MPFTVTMPKLSPTMEEGTIAKWHKDVGSFAEAGDVLMEVSTDKATVEYQIIDSGWLRSILIKEGGNAVVNQPIAIFTENKEESIEGYQPEGVSPISQPAPLPEGEKKEEQEAAPMVATPVLRAVPRQTGFAPEPPIGNYAFAPSISSGRVKASPLAKKLAKEKGLDLSTIQGTGPGKRIVSKDLSRALPAGTAAFGRKEQPSIPPGTYEEQSLSQMRKVIGQRLQEAKSFIPHFYVSLKINPQPLIEVREQLKQFDLMFTLNDFFVCASALALKKHPNVNSGFNSVNQSLIRFKTIDIAVAVSIEEGLITPIIRHADFKSLGEISQEVKSLAARAKQGKLEPHEYKGGSFTISNLGMYGVSEFIAIINPPQAAILAISGIQEIPVIRNGQIIPGKEMILTLSGDHRVIDGVAAAEFLRTLQILLENPAALLIPLV